MIVVAVVVLVLAVAVFVAFKVRDALKGSPRPDAGAATLRLPSSFGAFTVAKDPSSVALLARMDAASKPSKGITASGGHRRLYINPGGHRLLVIGISAHDSADARGLLRRQPHETTLSNALSGYNVVGATDIATSPYSGVMQCGLAVFGSNDNTPVCAWVDDDTFVTVLDLSIGVVGGTAMTAKQLAIATTALRAEAESH